MKLCTDEYSMLALFNSGYSIIVYCNGNIFLGVSGKWVGAWIILSQRELYYAIDKHRVKKMDLRKARCIVLQSYQDTENNPRTNDRGPNMLIDCPDLVLYLRMWTARETKVSYMCLFTRKNNYSDSSFFYLNYLNSYIYYLYIDIFSDVIKMNLIFGFTKKLISNIGNFFVIVVFKNLFDSDI